MKVLLDSGVHKLSCPKCGQSWAWQEVRSQLLFSDSERRCYEEKVSRLAKGDAEFHRKCPGCGLLVQRLDAEDYCGECPACCGNGGKTYQFCWSCTREWRGESPQGAGCKRETCSMVALLLSCPSINNPLVTVNGCPVVRACPDCRTLIAHAGGCKYVTCRNCSNCFCYRCLETYTACYGAKPQWYHVASCAKPMAPRQAFLSS
ncbi:E3 ubiquitin-protein ligase RNF19B-like [Scyliorhinus canicula]|uniref:E3 ubiquitin-protein ligase RNF19B-like n=1 Tax=Scyliorhinus canicula TaxID=7830 RepID=UPI0018F5CB62|nr:E3 ubiquitin-protein ligase RNF19B-like [Scyliorhinus canicula]